MSTSSTYLQMTRDMTRTMSNLARERTVTSSAQYYQANIGKVKTVDDLMGDFKLYNYVMRAYGLEDMAYAKAFIKKVLTSDLSDTQSFANKLTDKRYQNLASAFSFGTDGKVSVITDIQSDAQEKTLTDLYAKSIAGKQETFKLEVDNYSLAIDAVTNVDAFLNDSKLFSFAMTSVGLGSQVQFASKSFYRDLLTKDLSDPTNPIASISDTVLRDQLTSFKSAFSFQADGTVASGAKAQTAASKSATIDGYLGYTGQTNASFNILRVVDNYRASVPQITHVDDLLADTKTYNFVLSAYGLNPAKVSSTDVHAALVSDPDDPAGAASSLGLAYQRMARAFNFNSDGSLTSGDTAQTTEAVADTVRRYLAHAAGAKQDDLSEFSAYKLAINNSAVIANVDDLLQRTAIYNFVLRSFGLDPAFHSKDSIRSALTSDLNDPSSFANQQTDDSYRQMAQMFNFNTDGTIAGGGPLQSDADVEQMQLRYMGKGFGSISVTTQATSAYRIDMLKVDNVDKFLADTSSLSFALVAFGFDITNISKPFFRQVLTSDLNDPSSFANQQSDPRVLQLAQAFNFATDGSLPSGQAQSRLNEDRVIERFLTNTNRLSPPYLVKLTDDYATTINTIRTVSSLMSDANQPIYELALKAHGIDPSKTTKSEITAVLSSNLADPNSSANKLGGNFLKLAQAFNFSSAGIVPTGTNTQTPAQIEATVTGYLANSSDNRDAQIAAATKTFTNTINALEALASTAGVKPIDAFLSSATLYNYSLRAFGLDPTLESKADIRRALLSDPSQPSSFVNQPGNAKYQALARAFNFDADGTIGTPRMAQELDSAKRVATKYAASFPTATGVAAATQKAAISAETDYYATAILKVSSVDELLADNRMTAYIRKAFGFGSTELSKTTLKSILTSDLGNAKSFANASKDMRFREIAAAFNFDTKGNSKRIPELAAQSSEDIYKTYESFLQQTLETNAGAEDAGVRLALYFRRNAANITGPFSIMADKALYEVVRTALQIPEEAIRANIDVLARSLEKRINFADFKDPAKVEKFIKQFTALYDINNQGGTSSSNANALALISGSVDTSFSNDLLSGLQRVRASRF